MSTRNIVKNIRSAEVIQGKPKLPTSNQLDYGEIAVNYASGHETLSLKNDAGNIVSLSIKTVDDVTVNGNSVVSNKTANIIMKGNTTPVADTYSTTTFPSPFESKAEHISASDKVNVALKKVETNISKLVSEVVDNENVVSEAISKLANSAGTVDGSNNITYVKATNAHYISDATSVHDATVKLDSNVYSIGDKVTKLENNVNTITSDVSNLGTNYGRLNGTVGSLESIINNLQSTVNNLQIQISTLQEFTNNIPTMEYIDLGLPSGLQWAKCNLGAATETDYGDYFMWGSTTPDNNHTCNWANTPFNNGSDTYNKTYFTDDVKNILCPNGVLAKEFDAAYKATNGIACMPTVENIQELLDNTVYEWFTNYKNSGVKGRKFTSKHNGNSIFIPASGWRFDSSFNSRGISGYFWSSTLMTSDPKYAWGIIFGSDSDNISESSRNDGCAVRAVRK